MIEVIQTFWEEIKYFLKQKTYINLLLLTCILAYGFSITHYSVGLDDTVFLKFFFQGGLLAQGRFGLVLLNRLLFSSEYIPFWNNFLAAFFLFWSAIIWSALIKTIVYDKFSITSYIIFSTIFVSYSLIYEIFVFSGINLAVCLCYGLVAISLFLVYCYVINPKFIGCALMALIITIFFLSVYESFAVVMVSGFLILLILDYLFTSSRAKTFTLYCQYLFKFIVILLVSITIKSLISFAIIKLLDVNIKNVAANGIDWIYTGAYLKNILSVIQSTVTTYFFYSYIYSALTLFILANILAIVCLIIFYRKTKSSVLVVLFIFLLLSNFSLTLLQCKFTHFRSCQVFSIYIAFIFMLAYYLVKPKIWLKVIYLLFVSMIVFSQTKDLNQRFFNNYTRYQEEKQIIIQVGNRIREEFDVTKPIVFVGYPKLSDYVTHFDLRNNKIYSKMLEEYSIERWNRTSIIRWGVSAFDLNSTELFAFFKMNGFDFKVASSEQNNSGRKIASKLPIWPKAESISEVDDFILVHFGNQ